MLTAKTAAAAATHSLPQGILPSANARPVAIAPRVVHTTVTRTCRQESFSGWRKRQNKWEKKNKGLANEYECMCVFLKVVVRVWFPRALRERERERRTHTLWRVSPEWHHYSFLRWSVVGFPRPICQLFRPVCVCAFFPYSALYHASLATHYMQVFFASRSRLTIVCLGRCGNWNLPGTKPIITRGTSETPTHNSNKQICIVPPARKCVWVCVCVIGFGEKPPLSFTLVKNHWLLLNCIRTFAARKAESSSMFCVVDWLSGLLKRRTLTHTPHTRTQLTFLHPTDPGDTWRVDNCDGCKPWKWMHKRKIVPCRGSTRRSPKTDTTVLIARQGSLAYFAGFCRVQKCRERTTEIITWAMFRYNFCRFAAANGRRGWLVGSGDFLHFIFTTHNSAPPLPCGR